MSKIIYLTKGQKTIVDDDNYEELIARGPWNAMSRKQGGFFAVRTEYKDGKKTIYMHIVISGGKLVTHLNGDTLDNQKHNLEELISHKNKLGTSFKKKNPKHSQYKGVYKPYGKRYRWKAQITIDGKLTTIGWFDTEEEAAKAYDKKAIEIFGVFASLNFPCMLGSRYFGRKKPKPITQQRKEK